MHGHDLMPKVIFRHRLSVISYIMLQNGSGEVSESASTSSLGSNSSHSKAPGAQLHNSNTNSSISTAAQQKLTSILYNPNSLMQVVSFMSLYMYVG